MTAVFESLSSPRLLRGTPGDIYLETFLDGKPVTPASAGTVTVTNQYGDTVASGAAVATTGSDRLSFTLKAAQTLDSALLTASWADVVFGAADPIILTSEHEIVGAHLFTIPEARAFGSRELKDENKFSNTVLWDCRDQVHDAFESVLNFSIGHRLASVERLGEGYKNIWLPWNAHTVKRIEVRSSGAWTAFGEDDLDDTVIENNGRLWRESGEPWTSRTRYRIWYESGPIHPNLRRAALILASDQLLNKGTDLPSRAISQTDQRGTFQLVQPGIRGSYFGLPAVDAVLKRLAYEPIYVG